MSQRLRQGAMHSSPLQVQVRNQRHWLSLTRHSQPPKPSQSNHQPQPIEGDAAAEAAGSLAEAEESLRQTLPKRSW
jgi:hypothetical protein